MERHGRYYDDKNCHDIKSSTSPSYFFSPTATENSIECYIYSLMLCANESFRTHDNKTTCRVLFHCHLWYRIQKHRIVLFFFQYHHLFSPEYCDFFHQPLIMTFWYRYIPTIGTSDRIFQETSPNPFRSIPKQVLTRAQTCWAGVEIVFCWVMGICGNPSLVLYRGFDGREVWRWTANWMFLVDFSTSFWTLVGI